MSTKHTKGPWRTIDVRDSTHVYDITTDGKSIATIWQYNKGQKVIDAFEQQANARLIAAAPELLEALHELIMTDYKGINARAKALAAIDKATK